MKFTRNASANWKGGGKDGKGTLTTQSTVLENTPYSYNTRFDNGKGTNPEELVGAAHAGCFTMKLSFLLVEAGVTPANLDTSAVVTFEDGAITHVELNLTGTVDMDEAKFREVAERAKVECPISKSLKAKVTLNVSKK